MLKCLFGHKFGKLDDTGHQYCERCGHVIKPHPCAEGHMWQDTDSIPYMETEHNLYGQIREMRKVQTFQTCTVCGEKRSIWN